VGAAPACIAADISSDRKLARAPRLSLMGMAACFEAIDQAKLVVDRRKSERIGVAFGTASGPCRTTERIVDGLVETEQPSVDPLAFQESVFNAPASLLNIHLGIKGPSMTFPMSHAAGGCALSVAALQIAVGRIDAAVVFAADELSGVVRDAFGRLGLITPNDGGAEEMRPFDERANGFVLSEGAAAVVIERASFAEERGAVPLARLTGWALGQDGWRSADIDPGGSGFARTMKRAMTHAGIEPDAVGGVLAGSMALPTADRAEAKGIAAAFGRPGTLVGSIKGLIGETMGPGSLHHLIVAVRAVGSGVMPGVARMVRPACDEWIDTDPGGRTLKEPRVMVNAFAWGGIYTSLIVEGANG
jgi:3-oxoacyl-(acyl-carrier-protein) synthase